ncbi:peptidase M16 [candidate division LCP-89 bacterium B3_LCP]|uniref:Peptidase M16 n=1 Tax=candidate division LCP-89 bacterium B3_LCP TaxID=2012998 RepID=A0A532V3A6_UNCL8|nr:MAG: peptidase M16 [candidate division LCP-89 bacterium B3_LCP]
MVDDLVVGVAGVTKAVYKKTITDDQLTIVSERIPGVRSVAVGIWVNTGSMYETDNQAGISHMLEHMVFKGTSQRSGLEIVQTIEGVGGHINAFTSKELTCFYVQVLDNHLDLALDVLCGLLVSPKLAEDDVAREKLVIAEEIRHYEDSPHDLIFDYFARTLHGEHPLARPIMGTVESVAGISQGMLRSYLDNNYPSNRTVVAATGNLDHDFLLEEIQKRLKLKKSTKDNGFPPIEYPKPRVDRITRPVQGVHICTGTHGISYSDPKKFAALTLSNILGGGMSSRLFQRIREKEALAYSLFSFLESLRDTGVFGVYLGTDPAKLDHTLGVLEEEYTRINVDGIPAEELTRVKEQLKGNLILGSEGTSGRMFRLAKLEIYLNRFLTLDETIHLIEAVTEEGIMEIAHNFLKKENQYTAIILPKEEV